MIFMVICILPSTMAAKLLNSIQGESDKSFKEYIKQEFELI